MKLTDYHKIFFIGIAGTGMSALAQYLAGSGKRVSGSDRYFLTGVENQTRRKLEADGIECFLQDGTGIDDNTELVVVSTAVEETVPEVQKARALSIPIIKRSELLALIASSKKCIAVGGTSGKSTTSAMLFQVLEFAGLEPSIISGAGLVKLIKEGRIGNAKVGNNSPDSWLIIEADESDGSIVQYKPDIGLLLNIDKDHQEIAELEHIFSVFKNNSRSFIVNQSNPLAKKLSTNPANDFATTEVVGTGYVSSGFSQQGMKIRFQISHGDDNAMFTLNTIGRHNMENAVAACAVAGQLGIKLQTCASALESYEGIYRRHQLLGIKNGITVIDDYAHNPAKCAASIRACQDIAGKVVAWFQPHGYGPTRFLKDDFVKEIAGALRDKDEIWMSEIFYAGGTAVKNISANDLVEAIRSLGKNAYFVEERMEFLDKVRPHLNNNPVLLLMGARDPGLEAFSKHIYETL